MGSGDNGSYSQRLRQLVSRYRKAGRIRLVEAADKKLYSRYLQSCDVAVQLRTMSRGESSRALADCLSHGIPTIVNANGSFAEIDPNTVVLLDDCFDDTDLITKLEALYEDRNEILRLHRNSKLYAVEKLSPATIASQYTDFIKQHLFSPGASRAETHRRLFNLHLGDIGSAREAITESNWFNFPLPTIGGVNLVDVTNLTQSNASFDLESDIAKLVKEKKVTLVYAKGSEIYVLPIAYIFKTGQFCHSAGNLRLEIGSIESIALTIDLGDPITPPQVELCKRVFLINGCVTLSVNNFDVLNNKVNEHTFRSLAPFITNMFVRSERHIRHMVDYLKLSDIVRPLPMKIVVASSQADQHGVPEASYLFNSARLDTVYTSLTAGIASQVGSHSFGSSRTNAKAGFILYGPYVDLKKGSYVIVFSLDIMEGGQAWLDIRGSDSRIHFYTSIDKTFDGFSGYWPIAINLDQDVERLEVRLYVTANTKLRISNYRIIQNKDQFMEHGGDDSDHGDLSNESFVWHCFVKLLQRYADRIGYTNFLDDLNFGSKTRSQIVREILASPEAASKAGQRRSALPIASS